MEIEVRHLTIQRRVRYAVLESARGPISEVWFALHGFNQLAHRFLRHFQPLQGEGRLFVAPEGLHRQYVDHAARKVGACWMTSEDRLTDIEDYVRYLDRLYEHIGETHDVDWTSVRVTALGFSQGVHTLCRWIAFGTSRIDRAVLWGATVPPDLDLGTHGPALSRADVQLVVGDRDEHLSADAVRAHEERLREAGIPFRSHGYSGGHRLDAAPLLALTEPS